MRAGHDPGCPAQLPLDRWVVAWNVSVHFATATDFSMGTLGQRGLRVVGRVGFPDGRLDPQPLVSASGSRKETRRRRSA